MITVNLLGLLVDSILGESLPELFGIAVILILSSVAILKGQLIGLSFIVSLLGARFTAISGDMNYLFIGMLLAFALSRLTKGILSESIGLLYLPRLIFAILVLVYTQSNLITNIASEVFLMVQILLLAILVLSDGQNNSNTNSSWLARWFVRH